jgi:hypothetical protein
MENNSMATHVKVLGILHLALGICGLLAALLILVAFGGIASLVGLAGRSESAEIAVPILGMIGTFVFVILMVLSLPGVIAGIGLLQRKRWARILTIVLSALELFSVPFGTALGVYGLWVLLSTGSETLFDHHPQPVRT